VPAGTLKAAGQVAEKGVAHLEMLEPRLGKWISKAETHEDQRPPQHGTDGIAESRPGLMEANAAIDGATEAVATRAINSILTEKSQDKAAERAPYLASRPA